MLSEAGHLVLVLGPRGRHGPRSSCYLHPAWDHLYEQQSDLLMVATWPDLGSGCELGATSGGGEAAK